MRRTTTGDLRELKTRGVPIVMVTAYDFNSASVAEAAGVDVVLVGDSAAMTMLGYASTRLVSLDEMLMLTRAVRRGLTHPLLVGDLPFGSYEQSDDQAMETAARFVDAGCDAVKLEGGSDAMVDRVRALIAAGIPVMGHVGLTPQSTGEGEGFHVHGRTADDALQILREATALEGAGCFAVVFEAIPAPVTALLVPRLDVPIIGIGAGGATDGQVLVFDDLVGLFAGRAPKFVKRFAEVRAEMLSAVERYAGEVRTGSFPDVAHGYGLDAAELDRLRTLL
ncbi:MAG: 3-methyl-2-oxobutanoate hydroxymethyltransferase [Gemmatimonadetes bacterium]|nr:3-methyl-2-oxobutanoate hydroxymethyltransferase [Gemmatimonadota bacterium]